MISTYLFDLDGTIWNSERATLESLALALRDQDVGFDKTSLRWKLQQRSPIQILKDQGVYTAHGFWRHFRANQGLVSLYYEDTREIFLRLRSHHKVGIVTALKGQIAHVLLSKFKLEDILDVAITPSETSARKPSPIPIILAMNRLTTKPEETIYVGDQNIDILSAKRAGCQSGWAKWGQMKSIDEKPDFVFASLEDVCLI